MPSVLNCPTNSQRRTRRYAQTCLRVCRGIMKQEWEPLLNFMEEKNIRISNLDQARQGPGFAPAAPLAGMDLGGDDEEDEEDDEFGAGGAMAEEDGDFDAGGGSGSDSSENDSDAELIPEDGITVEAVGGTPAKNSLDLRAQVSEINISGTAADGICPIYKCSPTVPARHEKAKSVGLTSGGGMCRLDEALRHGVRLSLIHI